MKYFMPASSLRSKRPVEISTTPRCGMCGLKRHVHTPDMPVHGKGQKGILIVGAFPGQRDDKKGKPFLGDTGRYLDKLLRQKGINRFKDCWTTFALCCRPMEDTAIKQSINCCRPNLLSVIKKHKPHLIIVLGEVATKSLVGHLWKEDLDGMSRWRGFLIPEITFNTWIAPLDNPQWVMGSKDEMLKKYFKKTLFAALKKTKQPHKKIPNYQDQIEVITNPAKAARTIRHINNKGGAIAFDYEGNCLKPETPGAKLVSCSISYKGKKTIAYPLRNEAIEETINILKSNCAKIAANIKFEHRWTRYMYKTRVRNWWWDTMLASHVIDNRPKVTGLKFQVFTMLGAGSYDDHIKPFLKSTSTTRLNRILDIDERDLLLYNGLDSLYEYKIAIKQMKLLGRM